MHLPTGPAAASPHCSSWPPSKLDSKNQDLDKEAYKTLALLMLEAFLCHSGVIYQNSLFIFFKIYLLLNYVYKHVSLWGYLLPWMLEASTPLELE